MRKPSKNFWLAAALIWGVAAFMPGDDPEIVPLAKDEAGDPWDHALQVRSAHVTLSTDVSREEAVRLVADLERFRAAFFDCFSGTIDASKITRPLEVHFYADVRRFKQAMRKIHPEREEGDGFFSTQDGIAHFFKVRTKVPNAVMTDREAVFHECTHQVMHQALGSIAPAVKKPHFWVVEGLAGYFEGLGVKDDARSPEESRPNRLKFLAEHIDQVKTLKLSTFFLYDQEALMKQGLSPEINYAVCAGLAYFLSTAQNGRTRDAFRRYALTVHEGKARGNTFREIFGSEPDDLQKEWETFLDGLKK